MAENNQTQRVSLSWGTLIYFVNVSVVTTTKYKSDRKREKEKGRTDGEMFTCVPVTCDITGAAGAG